MTLQERILNSEQKFEQKKVEREQHLKLAEDCLTEMTKLQGEWRVLKDLLAEENSELPADDATTLQATPEVTE